MYKFSVVYTTQTSEGYNKHTHIAYRVGHKQLEKSGFEYPNFIFNFDLLSTNR